MFYYLTRKKIDIALCSPFSSLSLSYNWTAGEGPTDLKCRVYCVSFFKLVIRIG